MEKDEKQIKDIFPEYTQDKVITQGKIVKLNLHKKTNKLEMYIKTKYHIPLKEILNFENFLKSRFQIEKVSISIKYEENVKLPNIEEEWKEIILYLTTKYPTTKMLLKNSNLEINDNKFLVVLSSKGAEYLIKRGFVEILEDVIYRIYNKKYKVEYIEKIDEDEQRKFEENAKLAEKLAVELAQQEMYVEKSEDLSSNERKRK